MLRSVKTGHLAKVSIRTKKKNKSVLTDRAAIPRFRTMSGGGKKKDQQQPIVIVQDPGEEGRKKNVLREEVIINPAEVSVTLVGGGKEDEEDEDEEEELYDPEETEGLREGRLHLHGAGGDVKVGGPKKYDIVGENMVHVRFDIMRQA